MEYCLDQLGKTTAAAVSVFVNLQLLIVECVQDCWSTGW